MLCVRNTLLPVMEMEVIAQCSKKVSKPYAHLFNYLVGLLGYLDKWKVNCAD